MKVRNIIFDVGGVLFRWSPSKTIIDIAGEKDHIFYLKIMDEVWRDLDKGLYEEKEIFNLFLTKSNFDTNIANILMKIREDFYLYLEPIRENIRIFHDLADSGYNLYILSNFQKRSFNKFLEKHPFLSKAKGIVISESIKSVKPEKRIYQALFDLYNVNPKESLFIDDEQVNIDMARRLGMFSFLFSDISEFNIFLKKELYFRTV